MRLWIVTLIVALLVPFRVVFPQVTPPSFRSGRILNFGPIKDNLIVKGMSLVREIDLRIDPDARSWSCDSIILFARERAVYEAQDLFASAALLPDSHSVDIEPGQFCTEAHASLLVSDTRRKFVRLVKSVARLVARERICRAKYGLSYPPSYADLGQINRELNFIPKVVRTCR